MNCLKYVYCVVPLIVALFNPSLDSAPSVVQQIFEIGGYDQNDIGQSQIWGDVDPSNAPWVMTDVLGWVYLYPDSLPDGYWIWVDGLGWLHSASGKFPNAYLVSYTEEGEILLDIIERKSIRYWHYGEREWRQTSARGVTSENPIAQVQATYHSKVPDEYIGLSARHPKFVGRTYSEVLVGPYYLIVMDAFVGIYTLYTYYYDSERGKFIPLDVRSPYLAESISFLRPNFQEPLKLSVKDNALILETENGFRSTYELLP